MIQLHPTVAVDPDKICYVRSAGPDVRIHFVSGHYITLTDTLVSDVLVLLSPDALQPPESPGAEG